LAFHVIKPERRTLHGHFSRDLAPILEVASGDTVRFTTLDCGWGLQPRDGGGEPQRTFEPRDPELDFGHALCGPVAIIGAMPGMTLEVQVGQIRTGGWGWTEAGGWVRSIVGSGWSRMHTGCIGTSTTIAKRRQISTDGSSRCARSWA